MAYEFSYTSERPRATANGSGQVTFFIIPCYREEGDGDWLTVLGTEKVFYIYAEELATVNAMPHSTTPQKAAKSNALITLVLDSAAYLSLPYLGWTEEDLEAIVTANALSETQATATHEFITVTMGQSYPVRFTP